MLITQANDLSLGDVTAIKIKPIGHMLSWSMAVDAIKTQRYLKAFGEKNLLKSMPMSYKKYQILAEMRSLTQNLA